MSKLPNVLQFIFELIKWGDAHKVLEHLHQRSVCDPPLEIFHWGSSVKSSDLTGRQMGPWKQAHSWGRTVTV